MLEKERERKTEKSNHKKGNSAIRSSRSSRTSISLRSSRRAHERGRALTQKAVVTSMLTDNQQINSNIRPVKAQQPIDYKGNPVDLEARIFLAKKQGGWNKELGSFNKYISNRETVVKEGIHEK